MVQNLCAWRGWVSLLFACDVEAIGATILEHLPAVNASVLGRAMCLRSIQGVLQQQDGSAVLTKVLTVMQASPHVTDSFTAECAATFVSTWMGCFGELVESCPHPVAAVTSPAVPLRDAWDVSVRQGLLAACAAVLRAVPSAVAYTAATAVTPTDTSKGADPGQIKEIAAAVFFILVSSASFEQVLGRASEEPLLLYTGLQHLDTVCTLLSSHHVTTSVFSAAAAAVQMIAHASGKAGAPIGGTQWHAGLRTHLSSTSRDTIQKMAPSLWQDLRLPGTGAMDSAAAPKSPKLGSKSTSRPLQRGARMPLPITGIGAAVAALLQVARARQGADAC